MAAKSRKSTTKANARDNKLYLEYEKPDPDETASQRRDRRLHRDYLFRRRHLATVIDPNGFRTMKWTVEVDDVESTMDEAMERILNRDGRLIYKEASDDLLRRFACTINHMDGGPTRLIGMLHQLEARYVKLERPQPAIAA
jgi:hypothetical protein